jgi:hypothetical protein
VAFRGHVDSCQQWHVAGWAADSKGNPAHVIIHVNGRVVTSAAERVHRPDLAAHGISEQGGFSFVFEQPLDVTERVEVLLTDGSHLHRLALYVASGAAARTARRDTTEDARAGSRATRSADFLEGQVQRFVRRSRGA